MRWLLSFTLIISLFTVFYTLSKKTPSAKEVYITSTSAYLDSLHAAGELSGNVLVADKGEIIFSQSYGLAEHNSDRALIEETPFYLASVSKQFTCMSILILANQGKLNIDDKASQYLDLPNYASEVTIRQMMNHVSGLPDYYDIGAYKTGMTNKDVNEAIVDLDSLDFPSGSKYAYSNTAYVLLSEITEAVSGTSFREFMAENVFSPLEMTSTTVFDTTEPAVPNRAKGYNTDLSLNDYDAFTTGGGGIFSNVQDLLKWERTLYTEKLIPQELLQQAYTPSTISSGEASYYGFGWFLSEEFPKRVYHTGTLAGFRTCLFRDLDRELAVIILSNHSNEVLPIAKHLVDTYTKSE
ncbi:MAG: serine hydrolase domain-containing protein [Bacteroidota bacterium]